MSQSQPSGNSEAKAAPASSFWERVVGWNDRLWAPVEEQVGVPVKVVGVGAERDDYLVWAS